MSQTLVIVESPAKARTIGRYLGKNYRIAASVGHIRDLPSAVMGVDVRNRYKPMYINMPGKDKVIRELKDAASRADQILIATDPDREGEAIAWHVAKVLSVDETSPCRISFNEITEHAVHKAINEPRPIDMNLVHSQQARRILDRLVGYELSPLLWKKIRKGLSAGRVQSVATRMIVLREREIEAFVPQEYWNLTAWLAKREGEQTVFRARYYGEINGAKVSRRKLADQAQADQVAANVRGREFAVWQLRKGTRQRLGGPPFTTSTLQQEAGRALGFTAKRTMSIAQQLYEGVEIAGLGATALVTYIRTDSVRISAEALHEARQLIEERFGKDYLPKSPRYFKNRNAAQDAHEAIRPAHFELSPQKIRERLSQDQYRLYKLIWDRFIASQMAAAAIDTVTADLAVDQHVFRAQGESIRFPGFLAIYDQPVPEEKKEPTEDADETDEFDKDKLPELSEGEQLSLRKLDQEQKFTQPPARYTEATLIKALEEQGIGRPSTYAPTLSTIQDRQYVTKEKKFLHPTELGRVVTGLLEERFASIVDLDFTARMENELDAVESGDDDWISVLDRFYPDFHRLIRAAEEADKIMLTEEKTGEKCPDCQVGDLIVRQGRYGQFIACNRYPDCTYSRNQETVAKGKCPLCGSGLLSRTSKKFKGRPFFTCDKKGTDPECPFISWDPPVEGRTCATCGSYMVWRRFRGKTYPRCGNRDCPTNARRSKAAATVNSGQNKKHTGDKADKAANMTKPE